MAIGRIFVELRAQAQKFQGDMNSAARAVRKFGFQAGDVGRAMTAGLTLPVAAVGTAAIKMSMDFNASMANVASLIPDNTKRVNELKKSIQDAAIATGTSTTVMSEGLYQLVSAFGDSADTADNLRLAAETARAGLATVPETINLLSAVTKGYGDTSAEAMQKASDLAFVTVKLGQTTFPELAASMGRVIPLAAKMNVSQEELFASMATLTGVTGNAAEVSTQMAAIMKAMLKPTEDMKTAIDKLKMGTAENVIEQLGMVGALEAIIGTTDGTTESIGKLFGRAEALVSVFALTGTQAGTFAEKLEKVNDYSGATTQALEEQTEGVNAAGFAFDQAQERVAVLAQNLGDELLPIMARFLDKVVIPLLEKTESLVKWFGELDETTQTLTVSVVALGAALGPILIGIGFMATNLAPLIKLLGPYVAGTGAAAGATTALGGALAALAPVAALVAAIWAGFKWHQVIKGLKDLYKIYGDLNKAEKDLAGQTKMMQDKLRDLGITVDRGPNEALGDFSDRLKDWLKMAKPTEKALGDIDNKFDGLSGATKKALEQLDYFNEKADTGSSKLTKYTEDQQKMLDQWNDLQDPGAELIEKLELLRGEFDEHNIVLTYWQEILNTKEAYEALNKPLPETLAYFAEAAERLDAMRKGMAGLADDTWHLKDSYDVINSRAYEPFLENVRGASEAVGHQAKKMRDLAEETNTLNRAMDDVKLTTIQFGDELPPIHGKLDTTKEKTKQLSDVISNQVSTIFTDLSKGIADSIVEWKGMWQTFKDVTEDFSKAILRAIFEQLFTPLITFIVNVLKPFLESFAKWMKGIFSFKFSFSGGGGSGVGISLPGGIGINLPIPGLGGGKGGGGLPDFGGWGVDPNFPNLPPISDYPFYGQNAFPGNMTAYVPGGAMDQWLQMMGMNEEDYIRWIESNYNFGDSYRYVEDGIDDTTKSTEKFRTTTERSRKGIEDITTSTRDGTRAFRDYSRELERVIRSDPGRGRGSPADTSPRAWTFRQGDNRVLSRRTTEIIDQVEDGLQPIRDFTTGLYDLSSGYDELVTSVERALTPLEKFAQFEADLMQRQNLSDLAQFALAPAFTSGQAVSSIVQQALDLGPELAGDLITKALSQFGPETTFGAVELLRRREFGSLSEAISAVRDIQTEGSAGNLTVNINVSSPDPNATNEYMLNTWVPSLVSILENRQDAGQIITAVQDQLEA